MSNEPEGTTRLRGRRLLLARVGWVAIVVPSLALGAWGFVVAASDPALILDSNQEVGFAGLGLTATQGMLLFRTLPTVWICVIALFVFAIRSDDWFAIFASVFYVTGGIAITGPLAALYRLHPEVIVPVRTMWSLGLLTAFLALGLFPDGRFVPPWSRIVAILGAVYAVLPGVPEFYLTIPERPTTASWQQATVLALFGAGYVAQRQRYVRYSTLIQRRHIRYVVGSLGVVLIVAVQALIVDALFPGPNARWLGWSSVAGLVALILFQVGLAASIVRHRLFDIERIVNRVVVYGAVSAVLGVVYAGAVFLLGLMFRTLTGGSDLVIAGSTLAIAVLFRPVRRRMQAVVDRRFNRARYDAARTIEAFTARLREEIDLDALGAELTGVVGTTMQPAHVSLWIRSAGKS